jgi:hypothetical protein
MKKTVLSRAVAAASLLAVSRALGQVDDLPVSGRLELPSTNLNQFRVSCRLGYNISAHLENIAAPAALAYPPSVTGVTYQDGYVAQDSSGNAGGVTWNWGYARSSQVAGDNLLLSYSNPGQSTQDFRNDPQPGLEIAYARELGVYQNTKWGIEGAFTYLDLNLRANGVADPRVMGVDAFPLGGVIPPLAPYNGSFAGPGPLIGVTPTRYPVNIVSTFDAAVFGLKLGPYFEFPLTKKVFFTLDGGFALMLADSDFRIEQSTSLPGVGVTSTSLRRTDVGILPGVYIGGRLSMAVSDSATVFTGLEYESAGHHTQTVGNQRADVDFFNSLYLTFGFSYSF